MTHTNNQSEDKHKIGEHGAVGFVTQDGRICAECGKKIEDKPHQAVVKEEWEKAFSNIFLDLQSRMEATVSRIPVNTNEGVVDLGTVVAIEIINDLKDFIKQVRQQAIKETIELFDEAITDTFFESELKSECYSSLKKRLRIIKNSLTQSESQEK